LRGFERNGDVVVVELAVVVLLNIYGGTWNIRVRVFDLLFIGIDSGTTPPFFPPFQFVQLV
jgi:hypothetical protein